MKIEVLLNHFDILNVIGDLGKEINDVKPLGEYDEEYLMWCNERNNETLERVSRGVIICKNFQGPFKRNCTYLLVDNPRYVFSQILRLHFVGDTSYSIAESASVDRSVFLSKTVKVSEGVVIEENCIIGENVIIGANTIIHKGCRIGNNVMIGSNNTIGGAGFGYEKNLDGDNEFIPHVGNVLIGESVEIGNHNCIDRAVLGSTLIEDNVKIDNLVHIAHGVRIGRNSLIIANVQIAGSVNIGENCWIAPSSTIIQKVNVGDNVHIGIGSVVLKDISSGCSVFGNPARVISRKDNV